MISEKKKKEEEALDLVAMVLVVVGEPEFMEKTKTKQSKTKQSKIKIIRRLNIIFVYYYLIR